MKKRNRKYWITWAKAAGVRAIKTVAQTAIATIGVATMIGEVDWRIVASTAVLSGIMSLLTSVAGLPEVPTTEGDNGGEDDDNDSIN